MDANEKAAYEAWKADQAAQREARRAWYTEERAAQRARWTSTVEHSAENDAEFEARMKMADALVKLQDEAQSLAENMTRLVEQIKRQGLAAWPNSVGEVQGKGFDVDRMCVVFAERRDNFEAQFGYKAMRRVRDEADVRSLIRENGLQAAIVLRDERNTEISELETEVNSIQAKIDALPEKTKGMGIKAARLLDRQRDDLVRQANGRNNDAMTRREFVAVLTSVIEEKQASSETEAK